MDLLVVAKISGTHHLKGAVKVLANIENLEVLIGTKAMVELQNGTTKILTVKEASEMVGKKWTMEFEEITNKTDAALLQNALVKVRRDLLGMDEDEYLVNDVIGMKVYEENGEYLGDVSGIFETAAHDIFVVESEEFETMIPDIDVFVKNIDFENNKMVVSLIEGMKEKKK
ncbi:ribosome maturation factor RimM [Cetobacterium sp. SF1]|uniref:ribosome maturation factor RimM n=1 Tax=unclassified Cetobacterium TaxID=2630983 RepID=UPI003CF215FA